MPPTIWPSVVGTLLVAAFVPAAIAAKRSGRPFMASLAATCVVASLAGLYSVSKVIGPLGDYQAFWLSFIGIVCLAVVVGEAAMQAIGQRLSANAHVWCVQTSGVMSCALVAAIGLWPFLQFQLAEVRSGSEDILLTLSRSGEHERLAQRPNSRTYAQTRDYFLDGVGLVDAPEHRP